jgi:hypothetical protein
MTRLFSNGQQDELCLVGIKNRDGYKGANVFPRIRNVTGSECKSDPILLRTKRNSFHILAEIVAGVSIQKLGFIFHLPSHVIASLPADTDYRSSSTNIPHLDTQYLKLAPLSLLTQRLIPKRRARLTDPIVQLIIQP